VNWNDLDRDKYRDEAEAITVLQGRLSLTPQDRAIIQNEAVGLVRSARKLARRQGVLESFLQEFSLGTREGLALMCLAEALLRTPDQDTRDQLIAEKIGSADWASHLGQSDNLFVNASTWGLMLTGRLVDVDEAVRSDPGGYYTSDQDYGRAVRSGADHFGGHQTGKGRRSDLFVRHARRGRADSRRCSAL
jgi:RHH-type proline utilization regulon transcriptional repressor/proline dehydrogenase/delta 1-pyrroline-5-carboxylate dehydrogenase